MKISVLSALSVALFLALSPGCVKVPRNRPSEGSPAAAAEPVELISLTPETAALNDDLFRVANAVRALKARVESMATALASPEGLEQANADLRGQREALLSAAAGLRDAKERVDKLAANLPGYESELARLREDIVCAERARSSALLATGDVKDLQERLERAERKIQRDQVLAEEREKQMAELRAALEASRRARPVPEKAEPVAPPAKPVEAEPKPVSVVKPPVSNPHDESGLTAVQQVAAGNQALVKGDLDRAIPLFRSAMERDETLVGARIGLAACFYSTDDIPEARRLLDGILREDTRNAQALGLRGIVNWKEGLLREADEDTKSAVELSPNDPQLHNYRGIVLQARGRNEEARREIQESVRLDPGNADALLNLAILMATAKPADLAGASSYYKKALDAGAARDEKLDNLLASQSGVAP